MKKRVDILINGNLVAEEAINGGGGILLCLSEDELLDYDIQDAVIVDGDMHVGSIDARDRTILVKGNVVVIGREVCDVV